MSAASAAVLPFHLAVPEATLDDMRARLSRTRWPEAETVDDWSQGVPLVKLRALCEHWRDGYDWRRCEAMLNGFGQYRTSIDGLGIHFLHVRSPEADALPMVMTHGWPGSVIEFAEVIGPLTDPVRHGGEARDAFHLVLPSMPGYGFSDKPSTPGWNTDRIAAAWTTLMGRLGYRDRYVAQGGDWGAIVTTALAEKSPPGCLAAHVNTLTVKHDSGDADESDPEVRATLAAQKRFQAEMGYLQQQSTRPQTLGYGLADSPVAQAAWIYEKLHAWSDHGGEDEEVLTRDAILDNVMLYWLPNAGASSARLYWESMSGALLSRPITIPMGVTIFPKDTTLAPRAWAERHLRQIIHWNEPPHGGHFGAFEQPAIFVDEVRQCFRAVR